MESPLVPFAAGRDLFHWDGVNYTTVFLLLARYIINMPGSGDNKAQAPGEGNNKSQNARDKVMNEASWCAVLFFMANAIYVASYAVTNMVLLRVLTVVAGITTLPYFYLQAEPLWLAMFCQSAFVAINLYHLGRLLLPGLNDLSDPDDFYSS